MTGQPQILATEDLLLDIRTTLDALNARVAALNERLDAIQRSQTAWADLQVDLTPVLREALQAVGETLAESDTEVTLDDLLWLLRQLWRHIPHLTHLLEQLESVQDLSTDLQPVMREGVLALSAWLQTLEEKGYFAFLREAWRIVDNVVTNFTPEDVKALADNVVLILNTVKELTQPDIMQLLQALADTYREVQEERTLDTSTLGLLRQMRDPHVRRGLALTMQMLRLISLQRPYTLMNGQETHRPTGLGQDNGGTRFEGKGTEP